MKDMNDEGTILDIHSSLTETEFNSYWLEEILFEIKFNFLSEYC